MVTRGTAFDAILQGGGFRAARDRHLVPLARRVRGRYALHARASSTDDPRRVQWPDPRACPSEAAMVTGSTVGFYRILAKLGEGGMGVVFAAEDLRLGRRVAIKFLPDEAGADPAAVERFLREARAISSLNHPHICTLHDIGEFEGRHYMVMELLEGETLRSRVSRG